MWRYVYMYTYIFITSLFSLTTHVCISWVLMDVHKFPPHVATHIITSLFSATCGGYLWIRTYGWYMYIWMKWYELWHAVVRDRYYLPCEWVRWSNRMRVYIIWVATCGGNLRTSISTQDMHTCVVIPPCDAFAWCDRFHRNRYFPEIHQIQKLKVLGTNSN